MHTQPRRGTGGPPATRREPAILRALVSMSIVSANQPVTLAPLTGGVSSDVYRVDLPGGTVCVKRALAKLKVAADWRAPVERNRWEVEWMRIAGAIVPAAVPEILGEDRDAGCFAMAYLAADRYPVWKTLLADGVADLPTAAAVGDALGRIHAATADRPEIAAPLSRPTTSFYAIRLEPYLSRRRARIPISRAASTRSSKRRERTKRVLVHGDFSPKNLLIGQGGPVILDAECAWYGDPAFDLAFVLNHLLLKGAWRPRGARAMSTRSSRLSTAYFAHVGWEPRGALRSANGRAAARADAGAHRRQIAGRVPDRRRADATKSARFARALLTHPVASVAEIARRWNTLAALDERRDHRASSARRVWDSRGRPTLEAEVTLERRRRSAARSPPPARRADRARRSTCATAARVSAAWTSRARSPTSPARSPGRSSAAMPSTRPASTPR